MNGRPLPIEHGAPARVRIETQLGFKMVKRVKSIELVRSYTDIRRAKAADARISSTTQTQPASEREEDR